MINKERFMDGLFQFADAEVMPHLPTSSQWGLGTLLYLSRNKANEIFDTIANNTAIRAIGVVNSNGEVDECMLLDALMQSANRYGKLEMSIPIIGTLRFSSNDVEALKRYMGG